MVQSIAYIRYLGESSVGKHFERQFVFFAGVTLDLAFVDSTSRDRRNSHPVTDENNNVLRAIFIITMS